VSASLSCPLILIVPDEIKVDPANFDFNFPTKIVMYQIFKKDKFSAEILPNLFELQPGCQKITF
jgi:hypothetical protein